MAKQETRSIAVSPLASINPRWISLGYGVFAVIMLLYGLSLTPAQASWYSPPLMLLLAFVFAAPLTGALLAPRAYWQRLYGLALIIIDTALVLGIVALSGGYASPFWVALFIPILSVLPLFSIAAGVGITTAIWSGYGAFVLLAPPALQREAAADWLLRGAAVGVVVLMLELFMTAQVALRLRAQNRERALHTFLTVSNKLRTSTRVAPVLEEVVGVAQAVGNFDCVALSRMDWQTGSAHLPVAIGAHGQRLPAIEGLTVPWSAFVEVIEHGQRVGDHAITCEKVPFRAANNERHLVLPLVGQFGEIYGLLTVSAGKKQRAALREVLPLLELLANQVAAALDNTALFTTLEQRVEQSTLELERSTAEMRRARDRAEVLYHIARALSVTLDERQVLERALALVAQSTGAERGGIMLVESNNGRLVFHTTLDRHKAGSAYGLERGQDLANWVLAHREAAVVPDTANDPRWHVRSTYDTRSRSALVVPLLLENEALGVMILIHSQSNHFHDDHAKLALAAASQAAVALSKAQLYRHAAQQSERLSGLVQQREIDASKNLAILRSIGDGVIVGDRLGRIRLINPAAEGLLGIRAEVFLGRALGDLPGAPGDDASETNRLHQIVLGDRTVKAHFAPVISSQGEWLGSVVVYHDISREVLADKLKSEFVATASHELRTPLTSMRGYVDMLMLGTFGTLSEAQRDFLKIIKNNVARLVELVDELLDISRAEAGETRLRFEEVNVADLLREATRSLHAQFSDRDIRLNLKLQDNPPRVLADRHRLEQIIVNLVGNACKYTPQGGQVDVSLRNGRGELRVDVRDTGVGITDEAKPHIFTPFYRADNPLRDEVGGTGLGLSITRKLVELHGGRIWFESKEGQGSIFSFTLPLDRAQARHTAEKQ